MKASARFRRNRVLFNIGENSYRAFLKKFYIWREKGESKLTVAKLIKARAILLGKRS